MEKGNSQWIYLLLSLLDLCMFSLFVFVSHSSICLYTLIVLCTKHRHRYFHITRHLPWVCSTEPPHPSYFLVGLLYYIVSTFLEPFEYVLQHRLPRFNNSGATSQLTAMKCVVWRSATQMPTGGMFAACTTVLVSCHSVYTLDMLTLFQCRTD